MTESEEHLERPDEGQIVFVHGGVAQYRDGVFYTGMEDPRWMRPIVWDVKWWLPITDWAVRTIEELRARVAELESRESEFKRRILIEEDPLGSVVELLFFGPLRETEYALAGERKARESDAEEIRRLREALDDITKLPGLGMYAAERVRDIAATALEPKP